jgi:hypothetical protein
MSSPVRTPSWNVVTRCIAPHLTCDDDPALWRAVVREIFRDAETLCVKARRRSSIFVQIGACSHWQRPHQHRWLKDGSFAAPYGYGSNAFNIHAWPVLDWSVLFEWNAEAEGWGQAEKTSGRRPLVLRIAVPTRTLAHAQAAVHSVWTPGSPTTPKLGILRLYGFRRRAKIWKCTATAGHEFPYETEATGEGAVATKPKRKSRRDLPLRCAGRW